ncbi:MAG: HepT-like ribonuclease domain-containing protein [Vicinamibacterales bacterium]
MLDMARKAVGKVSGRSLDAFEADENLRLALTHLIQVIGEAARRVSPEFSAQHPEVPWQEIVGMRHKVVHDYLGVDEDIVWQVVTQDLPPLIVSLEKILPLLSDTNATRPPIS